MKEIRLPRKIKKVAIKRHMFCYGFRPAKVDQWLIDWNKIFNLP